MNNPLKRVYIDLGIIPSNSSDVVNIQCFLHNESNGKALTLNFRNNTWICRGKCQKHGKLNDLLHRYSPNTNLEGDTLLQLAQYALGVGNGANTAKVTAMSNQESVGKDSQESIGKSYYHTFPISVEEYMQKYRQKLYKPIPYLLKRGFTQEIINQEMIYYNEYDHRVYLPYIYDNVVYGYISRSIYNQVDILTYIRQQLNLNISDKELLKLLYNSNDFQFKQYKEYVFKYKVFDKYLNSYKLDKHNLIYTSLSNNNIKDNNIYIVESILNSLKLNLWNYKSIALLGNGISKKQIELILKDYSNYNIILCFDNDQTGEKYYKEFIKLSSNIYKRIDFNLLKYNCNDINDIKNKSDFGYLRENTIYF